MIRRSALPQPPLLVVTDRHQARVPLERLTAVAFEAGCRWLLLREKDMPPAERLSLLERLVRLARPFGAAVMVSADIAAAKAAGAAGVHLPAGGDPAAARAALGEGALIGYSAHDLAEVEAAARAGADYVTLSPVFGTESKPGYGPALGLDELRAVAANVSIPVLALGGITPANARSCLEAGASGLAVMGFVMRAADPAASMAELLAAAGHDR
ncbi:MAG: thiamine phosphate synthase [Kiloniellaceae bacterium]